MMVARYRAKSEKNVLVPDLDFENPSDLGRILPNAKFSDFEMLGQFWNLVGLERSPSNLNAG